MSNWGRYTPYERQGVLVEEAGLARAERRCLLVVDEAHYVKNPSTRRAGAVSAWAGTSDRV
ncbi:hypothetical protein ACWDRX_39595, partial [Streptomyces nigra]